MEKGRSQRETEFVIMEDSSQRQDRAAAGVLWRRAKIDDGFISHKLRANLGLSRIVFGATNRPGELVFGARRRDARRCAFSTTLAVGDPWPSSRRKRASGADVVSRRSKQGQWCLAHPRCIAWHGRRATDWITAHGSDYPVEKGGAASEQGTLGPRWTGTKT